MVALAVYVLVVILVMAAIFFVSVAFGVMGSMAWLACAAIAASTVIYAVLVLIGKSIGATERRR